MKEIMQTESPRQAYDLLKEHGLECDYDAFLKTIEMVEKIYERQHSGLLSEQDMDDLLDNSQTNEMMGTIFFALIALGA